MGDDRRRIRMEALQLQKSYKILIACCSNYPNSASNQRHMHIKGPYLPTANPPPSNNSKMISFTNFVTLALASLVSSTVAFPQHGSLAGLSKKDLDVVLRTLKYYGIPNPPEPIKDTGIKLVNDAEHPYQDPRPGDIRGPCPGLNTLANHGVSESGSYKYFTLIHIFLYVQYLPRRYCHAHAVD